MGVDDVPMKNYVLVESIRELQIQNEYEYENDFKQCLLNIKYKTSQLKRSYNL